MSSKNKLQFILIRQFLPIIDKYGDDLKYLSRILASGKLRHIRYPVLLTF